MTGHCFRLPDARRAGTNACQSCAESQCCVQLCSGLCFASMALHRDIDMFVPTLPALTLQLLPLQGRALTTYIRRTYFPFLAKEPTLQPLGGAGGSRYALWTHYSPHSGSSMGSDSSGGGKGDGSGAAPQRQQLRLGAALLIPCLADLLAALTSLTAAIQQSGAPLLKDLSMAMEVSKYPEFLQFRLRYTSWANQDL